PVTTMVNRPVTQQVMRPFEEVVSVPRQIMQRVPVDYYDPFGSAITIGHSTFRQPSSLPAPSSAIIEQPNSDQIRLNRPEIFDSEPQTGLKGFQSSPSDDSTNRELELSNPQGDTEEIVTPDADILDAGYRIKWTPRLARSI
ncbi:MAG: hypothetical protein AAF802_12710, partial [Planctomycetota bacterium]